MEVNGMRWIPVLSPSVTISVTLATPTLFVSRHVSMSLTLHNTALHLAALGIMCCPNCLVTKLPKNRAPFSCKFEHLCGNESLSYSHSFVARLFRAWRKCYKSVMKLRLILSNFAPPGTEVKVKVYKLDHF